MSWTDWCGQWETARIVLAVLAGVALAALVSLSRQVRDLRHLFEMDVMNRLAPVLTVLPGGVSEIAEQGSLPIMVKNNGGGSAGDMQVEAQWGERRWALPLPTAVSGHGSELLRLEPIAADRKRKPATLRIWLRYSTVTGLVCTKQYSYVGSPGGAWFIVGSQEEVSAPTIRRVERRRDALVFDELSSPDA